jgi:hypothetical protein
MGERNALARGTLAVVSSPGEGTEIRASVPVRVQGRDVMAATRGGQDELECSHLLQRFVITRTRRRPRSSSVVAHHDVDGIVVLAYLDVHAARLGVL